MKYALKKMENRDPPTKRIVSAVLFIIIRVALAQNRLFSLSYQIFGTLRFPLLRLIIFWGRVPRLFWKNYMNAKTFHMALHREAWVNSLSDVLTEYFWIGFPNNETYITAINFLMSLKGDATIQTLIHKRIRVKAFFTIRFSPDHQGIPGVADALPAPVVQWSMCMSAKLEVVKSVPISAHPVMKVTNQTG
ncbi:hypothetical protein ACTXT7_016313 [Hymenolepis weldensis]